MHAKLNKLSNHSLILLMGDSGYGKTTFIANYLQKNEIPTVWYQLTNTDRYAHIFLSYIKTGIHKILNMDYSLETAEPHKTESELKLIIPLLAKQSTPLYIVLDNYELINSIPEIERVLLTLINNASSMIVFVIISRARPSLSVTHLKMVQRYMEISTNELAFTFDETEDFFNTIHQLALDSFELKLIHERTEGWIASYQLILGIIRKMNYHERSLFWSTFPNVPDIYDYLSTEVLEAQDNDVKLFLYRTSLLLELDPIIIDEFLDSNNARTILTNLLDQHLFIYEDERGVIRHHQLFRQFLYDNYQASVTNEMHLKEHRKLAEVYENNYQLINAFSYYTVGKDYLNATKVIGMIVNRYNPVESMLLLDGWLDEISPNESVASVSVFLIRCIPQVVLKELAILFEEDFAQLTKKQSNFSFYNLQHRLATIYFVRGEILRAKELFEHSLESARRFYDYTMCALNLIFLAEIYRHLGKNTEAIDHVRQSLFISDMHNITHTQVQALDTMATIYIDLKNSKEAGQYIQQALSLAEKYDHSSLNFVYTTMGRLARIKENFNESYKWGRKALALAERYGIEFDIGWSAHQLGISYLENREFKNAHYFLEKAYNTYSLSTLDQCLVGITQLELYEKSGDLERLTKKQKTIMKQIKDKNFYWLQNKVENAENVAIIKKQESSLVIRTFGNFTITLNGEPVLIKRSSSLRLLQYFITNRDKRIEKEVIIEEVFPKGSVETIQNQFHVSLSILRKALEQNLVSGVHSRFIKRSGNHYIFITEEIDLDVKQFIAFASVINEEDMDETIINQQKALQLFKGVYFEEYPYESFLEFEREQLQYLFRKSNLTLARHYYEKQKFNACFEYFDAVLQKEPDQEDIYFEYMELLLRQRLHTKASILANRMIRYFDKEMDVHVEEDVSALFKKHAYTLLVRQLIE